jgi:hypothetical protein
VSLKANFETRFSHHCFKLHQGLKPGAFQVVGQLASTYTQPYHEEGDDGERDRQQHAVAVQVKFETNL